MAEEKATAQKAAQKGWPRRAKGGGDKACTVKECKRPYRAKGYCFFHYKKWRQGELPHSRYRVCSKPECRTKATLHGLCEKHFNEADKAAASEASSAPAPAPAPAAAAAPAPAAPAPEKT